MTIDDTIGLSLRNLRQSKLRTALTTLGVAIGIASLAGMISLGVGLQDQVIGRFTGSGLFGTITVTSSRNTAGPFVQFAGRRGFGGKGGPLRGSLDASSAETPAPKLDDQVLKQLAGITGVREAYPNLRIPVQLSFNEFSRAVLAVGVPMSARNDTTFQSLSYGRFFTSESEQACVLSLDIARAAAENPGSLIGKNLTLSYAAEHANTTEASPIEGFQVQRVNRTCSIIGIFERDNSPFPGGGGGPLATAGVMIPIGLAKTIDAEVITNPQSLLRDPLQAKEYASITVKVKQPQFTQDVEANLKHLGYNAFSLDDALKGAKNAFIILDIFLSLIGSIALAVSSLGIVNTMVMSILERTREIGIMKALGASNEDVRRIFLVEAAVIGLLGGGAGIVLGWMVGRLINFAANVYIRSQGGTAGTLFSLPLWLIAGGIAFSIVVSLVAGSYPASRAARLDPIRALRHD